MQGIVFGSTFPCLVGGGVCVFKAASLAALADLAALVALEAL